MAVPPAALFDMPPVVMSGLMPLTDSVFCCMHYRALKTRSIGHSVHSKQSATEVAFATR